MNRIHVYPIGKPLGAIVFVSFRILDFLTIFSKHSLRCGDLLLVVFYVLLVKQNIPFKRHSWMWEIILNISFVHYNCMFCMFIN